LWVVSLACPLFGDPLVADTSEVNVFTAPEPCCREHETRSGEAD
jgi:hypothetical protein